MATKRTSVPNRPVVVGVTINILYPDGNCRTVTVDPSRAEAIFWSDRAVLEMLAPFYDTIQKEVTREELDKRFNNLDSIFSGRNQLRLTSQVIGHLWQLENEAGTLPPFIQKTVDCIPRPEPCRKCLFLII